MLKGRIGKVSVCMGLVWALCLTGCSSSGTGEGDGTAVQSVAMLAGLGTVSSENRYAGKVVSQNTVEVNKDADKAVAELKVAVGDEVKKGDVLFIYDVDDINRSIDETQLEIDKMRSESQVMSQQLADLQKEKEKASAEDQLSYSLEIQQQELSIKENEYNITAKEKELEKLKNSLENSEVTAEMDGIIQSINDGESGSGYEDDYGGDGESSSAYITIMQTGSYRVKGRINEQNVYELYEGMEVLIRSRIDDKIWTGAISLIDTTKADTDDSSSMYYYDTDSYTTSTKYAFYIELDDQEGLMIGQHVYIELDAGQTTDREGIWLSSYYLDLSEEGKAYAWIASDKDKLVKQEITLGEYDEELDEYQITEGLTAEDYIAIPEEGLTEGDSVIRYDDSFFTGGENVLNQPAEDDYEMLDEEIYDSFDDMNGFSEEDYDVEGNMVEMEEGNGCFFN